MDLVVGDLEGMPALQINAQDGALEAKEFHWIGRVPNQADLS